jgi:hypothetical protein
MRIHDISFVKCSSHEIEGLEMRSDPRMQVARKAGLKHYWVNFGTPGERHLLFVGANLGVLGPENSPEVVLRTAELQAIIDATDVKLQTAGLTGQPSLHMQWLEDA